MYYRVIPSKAGKCLYQLNSLKQIHTYFSGYLALVKEAHRLKRLNGLGSPFQGFFSEHLRVDGGPPTHPFVRLFLGKVKGVVEESRFWQGQNIAGSYAPSGRGGLLNMFTLTQGLLGPAGELTAGDQKLFGLPDNHAARVVKEWCGGSKVPIYPLALFLYRDLAIELDQPTTAAWVERFQEEFGYRDAAGSLSTDYKALFTEDDAANYQPASDWLMPYDLLPTTELVAQA